MGRVISGNTIQTRYALQRPNGSHGIEETPHLSQQRISFAAKKMLQYPWWTSIVPEHNDRVDD